MLENLFWVGLVGALIALIFALTQAKKVLKFSEGTELMQKLAASIRKGANAYLKRQYTTVAKIFIIVFVILLILAGVGMLDNWFIPFAFLTGGIWSGLAGFVGMKIATSANARTANAAHESLNRGLNVAFSSGAVMGFTVVGLGMLDISIWVVILRLGAGIDDPVTLGNIMVMNGMGASFMALFGRVGGGIFTKAADVGADLVGKVEAGIPEDDPRNPATIADNVGDNVGDVAGMGADLFESYTGSIIAPTILAVTFASLGYFSGIDMIWAVVVPVMIASCGILTSVLGLFAVRTKEGSALGAALNRGTYLAAVLEVIAILAIFVLWNGQSVEGQPIWLFGSVICGLVAGLAIGKTTEYFTSDEYAPVKKIAESCETGAATNIIQGISTGMLSTIIPIALVAFAIIGAYICGNMAFPGVDVSTGGIAVGLFGVALAATGMLSNTAITIGVDAYGPVADNAGGIAEMAGLPEEVRDRTDSLDAVGNTTAAIAKGFAIASAGLSAISLFVSYQATMHHAFVDFSLTLTDPMIIAGIFVGAMVPFMFAALTMGAVSDAAHAMVEEVRRQFREIKGIMEYEAEPEYDKCVAISTQSALHKMMLPGVLAVIIPIVIGCIDPAMLGGFLAGAVSTGMLLAIFMSNAGGAWDNAKKYIEKGAHGGKGSAAHKAAVVGDTVGDPFKDTSGPSMNILINLMTIISLTFSPLFIAIQTII